MAEQRQPRRRADEILDVAAALFFEKGFDQVGVDEIGLAAGLSGPAIYRHFPSKGDILAALFDQALDGLLSAVDPLTGDPQVDLQRLVGAHAGYVLSHNELSSVWIREGRSLAPDHHARLRRRERNHISHWIDVIGRRYPVLTDVECEVAAMAALSTLNSLALWPRHTRRESVLDAVTAFVISGLERLGTGDWSTSQLAV